MLGILNLHKPAGVTSRDVVDRVQRLVRPAKVGHAGTLDPLATGVLVVGVGAATRLVEYVQSLPKQYRGTFLLGRSSDTDDIEGTVIERPELPVPTLAELTAAVPQFVGSIEQTPPIYSAVKVAGQRAYARARRGQTVQLAPRTVQVYDMSLLRYEYPVLELTVRCGGGCYLRCLGRDLARAVGSDAVMSALERSAIGPFELSDAVDPDRLTAELLELSLLPPLAALADMPRHVCNADEVQRLLQGREIPIERPTSVGGTADAPRLVAVSGADDLVAILVPSADGGWRPEKTFPVPSCGSTAAGSG